MINHIFIVPYKGTSEQYFTCKCFGTNLEKFEGENFRGPTKLDEDESWKTEEYFELIYLQTGSEYAHNLKSIIARPLAQ